MQTGTHRERQRAVGQVVSVRCSGKVDRFTGIAPRVRSAAPHSTNVAGVACGVVSGRAVLQRGQGRNFQRASDYHRHQRRHSADGHDNASLRTPAAIPASTLRRPTAHRTAAARAFFAALRSFERMFVFNVQRSSASNQHLLIGGYAGSGDLLPLRGC
ncbi:hypothetical protein KCP73_19190 [Salmonella enterica subsp. enterica]|nr:hypothetical protein KCP73_19190 [Salmonella enterica subsp. enterica]